MGGFFQNTFTDCISETQTVNYNATTGKFTCLTDGGGVSNPIFTSPLTVSDGTTTSTLTANSFFVATSSSNLDGLFLVNSAGGISSSGTLKIFGTSTLAALTFTSATGTNMALTRLNPGSDSGALTIGAPQGTGLITVGNSSVATTLSLGIGTSST